jgi:hypothetical protein
MMHNINHHCTQNHISKYRQNTVNYSMQGLNLNLTCHSLEGSSKVDASLLPVAALKNNFEASGETYKGKPTSGS